MTICAYCLFLLLLQIPIPLNYFSRRRYIISRLNAAELVILLPFAGFGLTIVLAERPNPPLLDHIRVIPEAFYESTNIGKLAFLGHMQISLNVIKNRHAVLQPESSPSNARKYDPLKTTDCACIPRL